MEVMWGIKHLMKSLVPQEESELPMEERLQMSYGLKTVLNRHGFNVKPEMVRAPCFAVWMALNAFCLTIALSLSLSLSLLCFMIVCGLRP